MGLLPKNQEIGWTPYAYLVYLAMFFFEPLLREFSPLEWAAQIAVTVAFLALFFRGFWLRGRRLIPIIVAIALLGTLAVQFNGGGSVFFIYASGFLGEMGPPRAGIIGLGALLLYVVGNIFAFDLHPGTWIPAIVFSAMVGGLNIHFSQVSRRNVRLRLAQEEVERLAKSDERERIARDLHDLLGHTLSVITLKSQLATRLLVRATRGASPTAGDSDADAARTVSESDLQRARQEVAEVERISREAMAEVRRAVRGFRSLRLGTELAKARIALASAGVTLELESTPYDLPADVESVLSLALREGVTNVVRHARASHCAVKLSTRRSMIELTIEDDGRGIRRPEGSGLTGMRERVEALGGTLEIDDHRRLGTRLRVCLPTRGRLTEPSSANESAALDAASSSA